MKNGRVVATIHPFVFGQEIYAYVGDECVQVIETTIDQICDKIYMLCEKYNIDEVHFHGGQLYALKWRDDFVAHKFGKKNIEVHIH